MLKTRIVATVVVREGIAVQSYGFSKYLPMGKPEFAVESLNRWGADEIVLLDISASKEQRGPDLEMVRRVADACLVPLTVGGGVHSIDSIRSLMQCGADRVSVNQLVFRNKQLISEASKIFGSQSIVASVDAKKVDGAQLVYDYFKDRVGDQLVGNHAKDLEASGVGEILLNSIDKDGSRTGFDISLIKDVASEISIPLTVIGGAGRPDHFLDVLKGCALSGISAANWFNHYEHSIKITKEVLSRNGLCIRYDEAYNGHSFTEEGRLLRLPDQRLEQMNFDKERRRYYSESL